MNGILFITIYVFIDGMMTQLGLQSYCLAARSDAEVPTVGVVSAHAYGYHRWYILDTLFFLGYHTN
jgi:hypothetical protein